MSSFDLLQMLQQPALQSTPAPSKSHENDQEFSFSPEADPLNETPGDLSDFFETSPKPTPIKEKPIQSIKSKKVSEPVTPIEKKPTPTRGLYERGQNFLKEREMKRTEKSLSEYSFKPLINAESSKIVKIAMREGKNIHRKIPKIEEEIEEVKTPPPNKYQVNDFIRRNYTLALEQIKKRKTPKETEEEEFTFTPTLNENSVEISKTYVSDLFTFSKERNKKRKEKIAEMKAKAEEEEMKACTFSPQINKWTNISPSPERPREEKTPRLNYSRRNKL